MIEGGQIFFGEELDTIQHTYIKTPSYGNIFAQVVGKHGQPLIIVVHGSGPKNSSDQYLYMLHEYLVRVSYLQKFFVVAIDCPGYGRSKGSKQAVKTFPLQMFKEILSDLNYSSYFAMLGHSQGGAAIFNAVYQQPSLTEFLLMDRPVCGNIKRFNKFPIPTLLIYDIEDDGHPIWQGKLLFKQLLKSQFYTYRSSNDPYYVPDNLWNLILTFIERQGANRNRRAALTRNINRSQVQYRSQSPVKKQRSAPRNQKFKKVRPINYSMDKCEQIKKETLEKEREILQIKQVDRSELYSMIADLQELEDLSPEMNQPKIQESPEEAKFYENMKKQKIMYDQSNFMIPNNKNKMSQDKQKKQSPQKNDKKQKSQIKSPRKNSNQNQENNCSICFDALYYPVQTNCKHIFCKKCIGQSYLVNQRCPLCRTQITKRTFKEKYHQQLMKKMSESDQLKRKNELLKFEQMLKSIVYIEIGNHSRELPTKQSHFSKTKKKYIWQIFAKQPKNFKFEEVSFNINMGNNESKPIKVTRAPFVFESRGTFSFSIEITIKLKNTEYAPITSIYRIDIAPGTHSKMIAVKKKKNM